MKITTKTQMRRLYKADAFGNHLRIYTLEDLHAGRIQFPSGLMYDLPGRQYPQYCVHQYAQEAIEELRRQWISLGAKEEHIVIYEQPTGIVLLQGEVECSPEYCGLYLYYATVDDYMKPALAQHGQHATGIRARLLLQEYMDTASWENMNRLWEEYPDSIIEFTVFDHTLGTEGHNTVFWECRNY